MSGCYFSLQSTSEKNKYLYYLPYYSLLFRLGLRPDPDLIKLTMAFIFKPFLQKKKNLQKTISRVRGLISFVALWSCSIELFCP